MASKEVSNHFWQAFCHSGSIVHDCSCGRAHFATYSANDFEEGELEDLQTKRLQAPDKYIEHDQSSVHVIYIYQSAFVVECTCGGLLKYEKFILHYVIAVVEFLTNKVQEELKIAEFAYTKIKKLNELQANNRRVVLDKSQAEGR
jgi:hypothetical protein